MKKKMLAIAITVLMLLQLTACSGGGTDPASAPADGGTSTEENSKDKTSTNNTGGVTETPREETLYMAGIQWGTTITNNPISPGNRPFYLPNDGRVLMYETLFMYNFITGEMEPLLGESMNWVDDHTLEVKINPEAHWNDGEKLTSADVLYTLELGKRVQESGGSVQYSSSWEYIESAEAPDDTTFIIKLKTDPYNRLIILNTLRMMPIIPKHIFEKYEETHGGDLMKVINDPNDNPVASGPYKEFYNDETRATIVRDDNYWGKVLYDGKLPGPKYITHVIYKTNDAGNLAFKNGEVDLSQQFIPEVWKLSEGGEPFKTYLDGEPYYLSGGMPSIIFNMTKPGLDNIDVRRAIAMCIDYDNISKLAMSGYSKDLKPSIAVLNNDSESKYINDSPELDKLRWSMDVDAANALLDSIGAEKGSDGIRVLDGTPLSFQIECPNGWSDWNAALQIVGTSADKIGVKIETYFPEAPVYDTDRQTGEFDIIMFTYGGGSTPANPWQRAYDMMSKNDYAPIGQTAHRNYGRFENDEANELLNKIPSITDEKELAEAYTELEKIYLENIPCVPLMYRPALFHTVYEGVWQGFPLDGNNTSNIPPLCGVDGASIKTLWEISPVS